MEREHKRTFSSRATLLDRLPCAKKPKIPSETEHEYSYEKRLEAARRDSRLVQEELIMPEPPEEIIQSYESEQKFWEQKSSALQKQLSQVKHDSTLTVQALLEYLRVDDTLVTRVATYPQRTPPWHLSRLYRQTGSTTGTVAGLNKYQPKSTAVAERLYGGFVSRPATRHGTRCEPVPAVFHHLLRAGIIRGRHVRQISDARWLRASKTTQQAKLGFLSHNSIPDSSKDPEASREPIIVWQVEIDNTRIDDERYTVRFCDRILEETDRAREEGRDCPIEEINETGILPEWLIQALPQQIQQSRAKRWNDAMLARPREQRMRIAHSGLLISSKTPEFATSPDGDLLHEPSTDALPPDPCLSTVNPNVSATATLPVLCEYKCPYGRIEDNVEPQPYPTLPRYYHAQIQASMHLRGLQHCDFLVWTRRGLSLTRYAYDPQFASWLFSAMLDWYWACYAPNLVEHLSGGLSLGQCLSEDEARKRGLLQTRLVALKSSS